MTQISLCSCEKLGPCPASICGTPEVPPEWCCTLVVVQREAINCTTTIAIATSLGSVTSGSVGAPLLNPILQLLQLLQKYTPLQSNRSHKSKLYNYPMSFSVKFPGATVDKNRTFECDSSGCSVSELQIDSISARQVMRVIGMFLCVLPGEKCFGSALW
jgi:hypothetical protein